MPAHNAERFIDDAIKSILGQTISDLEFIIINDGSTDRTEDIILSYQDSRIIYIRNDKNRGLSYSFNKGIEVAQGKYLARMDADDISSPERLEIQSLYLKKNPSIDIVGSSIVTIDENNNQMTTHKRSSSHKCIKFSSLFSTPMYHPTVMGRLEIFKSHHFNESFSNSEDYELWSRLLFSTKTRFANINKPLLKYRIYPQSFTQTLNLDKRAVSAHNTIRNVEEYIKLNEKGKKFIIHLRQERFLPIGEALTGLIIYFKVTVMFYSEERPSFGESVEIAAKYLNFILNLFKHQLKLLIK